ncbi:MAG: hypothetical protein U9N86_11945 [Bacteroidota bacterium]|nr:hypothetical protein [Bacteroidota bacterium]
MKIIATVEKYRNEILQALGDKSIIENDSIFTLVNNFKQNYHEQIKTASFREENKKLLLSIVGFEKIVTDNFKPPKTAKTNHNNTDEVILK